MRWLIAPPAPEKFFAECAPLPRSITQILWNRGLQTADAIHDFLNPDYAAHVHDPFHFRDMHKAVQRIARALEANEKIVIHGDYDADGISGAVILFTTLKALGGERLEVFLPHREQDGYGLNMRTVERLAHEGAQVIITCDCGIANVAEVASAEQHGVDVIVTDHHQFKEELPPAYAILHPKIPGETYPDKTLSGGGVAFKLAQALLRLNIRQIRGSTSECFEKWLLDLVAVSSVADMVPLKGETRVLVKYGLKVLNKTKRVGLQALLAGAGKPPGTLDARSIGFYIAPRLNAAGRMQHARTSFDLLVSETPEQAAALASAVNAHNSERQKITAAVLKEARTQIEREAQAGESVLFAYNPEWPLGIMGLVANKLKDEFYRPMLVMAGSGEEVTGSGRSIPEINIVAAMEQIPQYFKKFGGHPQACGFTLRHENMIPEFEAALSSVTAGQMSGYDLTPRLEVDAELRLDEVSDALLTYMTSLEPFGMGNPEPKFLVSSLEVVETSRVGAEGKHARIFARQSVRPMKFMAFGMGAAVGALQPGDRMDAVVEVGVNDWNGSREIELKIADFRPAI